MYNYTLHTAKPNENTFKYLWCSICVIMMVKRQRRSNAVQTYTTGWSTLTEIGAEFGKSGTSWRAREETKHVIRFH